MRDLVGGWFCKRWGYTSTMLGVCALFSLLDTFAFGLTDLDEGFYASVAREMFRGGDYLTPHLAGEPWFEKPPLLYWLMVASMKVFGPSEFAVRLPSLMAFWLTLVVLSFWGNRRLGQGIGRRAALFFALSPLTMALARLGITDLLLTCWLTLALVALWETARKPVYSVGWGLATGLAILTKGPVALGLIALQTILTLPLLLREGLRLRWATLALLIALMVPLPWYVGVYLQHGRTFFEEFILKQNLLRFAGGDPAHAIRHPLLSLLYYGFVLWLGMFPFSVLLFSRGEAFASQKPAPSETKCFTPTSPFELYLRRWCWLVFGLFTLSLTKLPSYIFPLFPAASLLAAARQPPLVISKLSLVFFTVGALVWVGLLGAFALYTQSLSPLLLALGLLALSWHFLFLSLSSFPFRLFPFFFLVLFLIGFHLSLRTFDAWMLKPVRTLALSVPREHRLVVYKVNPGYPSLYFYRDGRAIMSEWEQEVRHFLQEGDYCLTVQEAVPPGEWQVVRSARVGRRTFVLIGR